jgi:hypothetical protein
VRLFGRINNGKGEFMKYKSMAALVLMTFSANTMAGVGLGVSLKENPTIFIPIDVGRHFRTEPFFSYANYETSSRIFAPPSPYTVQTVYERTDQILGIGLFGVIPVNESASIYLGGRIGKVTTEYENRIDGGTQPEYLPFEPEKS